MKVKVNEKRLEFEITECLVHDLHGGSWRIAESE